MPGIRRSTPTAASATAPGSPRPPAWSTCARWPAGTRLILRKERPHPGAQLRFTDADGMRVTAFITDTAPGVVPGQVAGLELRHRQHARVEDRIRELKATGLRNLPCHAFWANAAWLEIVLAAADLVTWTRLIGFTGHPGLARAEITTFRYRVLHVAARITRGARQLRLRIDATWRWAAADRDRLATHPHRLRIAPAHSDPTDHERPTGPRKARPTRRHGTAQPRHHAKMPTQQHHSAVERLNHQFDAKSRLVDLSRPRNYPDYCLALPDLVVRSSFSRAVCQDRRDNHRLSRKASRLSGGR